MKLLIEIPEEIYQEAIKSGYSHLYDEEVANAVANGKPLDDVLDEIKAKIEDESYLSYDDNPRHIIDESWVLEIIDKYKESEDKE